MLGEGGLCPLPGFVEDLSTMHWGPSKVTIYHPKVIISPQKCALFPQNRSGLEGGGGGVNPILAMPGFWEHLEPQPLPYKEILFLGLFDKKNPIFMPIL